MFAEDISTRLTQIKIASNSDLYSSTQNGRCRMQQDGSNQTLGHNSKGVQLRIEARFFNSLSKYGGKGGLCRQIELDAGCTVGDLRNP